MSWGNGAGYSPQRGATGSQPPEAPKKSAGAFDQLGWPFTIFVFGLVVLTIILMGGADWGLDYGKVVFPIWMFLALIVAIWRTVKCVGAIPPRRRLEIAGVWVATVLIFVGVLVVSYVIWAQTYRGGVQVVGHVLFEGED